MNTLQKYLERNGYKGDGTSDRFTFDKSFDVRSPSPEDRGDVEPVKTRIAQFSLSDLKKCADAAKKVVSNSFDPDRKETAVRAALFVTYPKFGLQGLVDQNLEQALVDYILGARLKSASSERFSENEIIRMVGDIRSNAAASAKYKSLRADLQEDPELAHLVQFLDRVFEVDAQSPDDAAQTSPVDKTPESSDQEGREPKMATYAVMSRIASLQAEAYAKLAEAEELALGKDTSEVPVKDASGADDEIALSELDKNACLAVMDKMASSVPEGDLKERFASIYARIKSAKVIIDGVHEGVGHEAFNAPNEVVTAGTPSDTGKALQTLEKNPDQSAAVQDGGIVPSPKIKTASGLPPYQRVP